MSTVTATQAKNSLLELLRDVEERGETVQITRNGVPAGVLVSVEEWDSLRETVSILSDSAAMKKIARARREIASGAVLTHTGKSGGRMAYRLLYLPGAEKDIRRLPAEVARRAHLGLEKLAEDPRLGKPLHGELAVLSRRGPSDRVRHPGQRTRRAGRPPGSPA